MKVQTVRDLFNLASSAKTILCYDIANACYAALFDVALTREWQRRFVFSYECYVEPNWASASGFDYFDLFVLSFELQSICIPVPLASPTFLYWKDLNPELIYKIEHKRKLNYALMVPSQVKYLASELERLAPNWRESVSRWVRDDYNKPFTEIEIPPSKLGALKCRECCYFDQYSGFCAVNPSMLNSGHMCPDHQKS